MYFCKLETGLGCDALNEKLEEIKNQQINESNCDIYITIKSSPNPTIEKLDWNNVNISKYIDDIYKIIDERIIQPQMITFTTSYIPIYDNDFQLEGKIINGSNLVHFFLSKNNDNKKLQIVIQRKKTGLLVDQFIGLNGRQFYDV